MQRENPLSHHFTPHYLCRALTLSPEDDEDGDEEPVLKWYDYLLHFIALPWKLFCAIIPPKHWLGGSLTFIFSIAVIGKLMGPWVRK